MPATTMPEQGRSGQYLGYCKDLQVSNTVGPAGVGNPWARSPTTSSNRMVPTLQRSALASYLWKRRISGAMYNGLPHSVSARPCARARPGTATGQQSCATREAGPGAVGGHECLCAGRGKQACILRMMTFVSPAVCSSAESTRGPLGSTLNVMRLANWEPLSNM